METFLFIRKWNDYNKVNKIKKSLVFIIIFLVHRNGRRLFPNFRISVNELDPNIKYMFLLDIIPMDDNRYKYHESSWNISGKAEPHIYGR